MSDDYDISDHWRVPPEPASVTIAQLRAELAKHAAIVEAAKEYVRCNLSKSRARAPNSVTGRLIAAIDAACISPAKSEAEK